MFFFTSLSMLYIYRIRISYIYSLIKHIHFTKLFIAFFCIEFLYKSSSKISSTGSYVFFKWNMVSLDIPYSFSKIPIDLPDFKPKIIFNLVLEFFIHCRSFLQSNYFFYIKIIRNLNLSHIFHLIIPKLLNQLLNFIIFFYIISLVTV